MLTEKGRAYLLLAKVRDEWHTFSPSQRAEVADLVERLSQALRREHSVATRQPRAAVPLVGRVAS